MSIRNKLIGLLWTLGLTNRKPDRTIHQRLATAKEIFDDALAAEKEALKNTERINRANGMSKFEIDGLTVWAINFKSAQRKATNEAFRLLAAAHGA